MPAPRRYDDRHSASELRTRLERSGGTECVELGTVRKWFGGARLSITRKREIAAALAAAGIDAEPPLVELSGRKKVRLRALPEWPTASARRPTARRMWRGLRARLLTPLGATITLAASLATLFGVHLTLAGGGKQVATRMSGDLNVAVVPFTTGGATTPEGVALARDATQALRSELPRLDRALRIEVRGPGSLPRLDGRDSASQASTAQRLAHAIGADIVVYGELAASPQATSLQPGFYLNAEKLPSATALGGGYGYGGAISLPYSLAVSPPAGAEIRAALVRRTEAYAQTFIGVGYYLLHSLAAAHAHLRDALASAPSAPVVALLRLLLGNVADQLKEPAVAARDYSLASQNASTRLRAELGLADVDYEIAHGHCSASAISIGRLKTARRDFAGVLRALGGLAAAQRGSPLAAKASFGVGQVDLCLSAARVAQRWEEAREEFAATVAAYTVALPELRDDAAESHAGIGLCALSTEGVPRAYDDALREYEAAARTTTIPSRRAYFEKAVGFAHAQLDQMRNPTSTVPR